MAKAKQILTREQAEEFTHNLGQITAGDYGLIDMAVNTLGVPAALGKSTEEWVQESLGGYVRWTVEQRREAVAGLTAEGKTGREVAEILGIAESTVVRDRAVLAAAHKVGLETDGKAITEGGDSLETESKPLTPAEKDIRIREMIAEGKSNGDIALALDISPVSVGKVRTAVKKEAGEQTAYEKARAAEDERVANLTPAQKKEIEAAKAAITQPIDKALAGVSASAVANYLDIATENLSDMISKEQITAPFVGQIEAALQRFLDEFEVAKAMTGNWERRMA